MNIKSKKKLFAELERIDSRFEGASLDHKLICNETYGRDSRVYVHCGTVERRKEIEFSLRVSGFKPNKHYDRKNPTTEVAVSYFRGHHWNE